MSPFIIYDVTQMTLTAASQNCLRQHVVGWEFPLKPLFMNIKITVYGVVSSPDHTSLIREKGGLVTFVRFLGLIEPTEVK